MQRKLNSLENSSNNLAALGPAQGGPQIIIPLQANSSDKEQKVTDPWANFAENPAGNRYRDVGSKSATTSKTPTGDFKDVDLQGRLREGEQPRGYLKDGRYVLEIPENVFPQKAESNSPSQLIRTVTKKDEKKALMQKESASNIKISDLGLFEKNEDAPSKMKRAVFKKRTPKDRQIEIGEAADKIKDKKHDINDQEREEDEDEHQKPSLEENVLDINEPDDKEHHKEKNLSLEKIDLRE
jgi:hypothetical protein